MFQFHLLFSNQKRERCSTRMQLGMQMELRIEIGDSSLSPLSWHRHIFCRLFTFSLTFLGYDSRALHILITAPFIWSEFRQLFCYLHKNLISSNLLILCVTLYGCIHTGKEENRSTISTEYPNLNHGMKPFL